MTEPNGIPRLCFLFDVSQSMNCRYGAKWSFTKYFSGLTRGEHAILLCEALMRSSPTHIYRYFISFQGDPDENPEHAVNLDVIRNKYKDTSRPRKKSNIIQRVQNVLQVIKNDVQQRSNSSSRLLIFSDGRDNTSTDALKIMHQRIMDELRSQGVSVIVINYGRTGLDFPDADHYNGDDFPPENMDRSVQRMLRHNSLQPILNDTVSNALLNSSRTNIRTLYDYQLSEEEGKKQYQHNHAYVFT